MGDTWRDQDRDRFAQIFETTIQALVRFMEEAGVQVPFLLTKAEKIREYQQHQL